MTPETVFSPDRVYSYTLWRVWGPDLPFVQFIGLNPSTADETKDDPTIRRCIAFAKSWGYGALCMTNIFAYRATDPGDMMVAKEPGGKENDMWLRGVAAEAGTVVAAWGRGGSFLGRGMKGKGMISEIKPLHCLRTIGS